MVSDLKNKVAIVTGASNPVGIGGAIAEGLAESGVKVVCADIDQTHLQETAESVGGIAIPTDISDPGATDSLVETTLERLGRLDILVNNAAVFLFDHVLDAAIEDFDRIMAVNLRGTFLCCRAAARSMLRAEGGSIVNISSLGGQAPTRGAAAYCASKGGIDALTRSLAADLAPTIRVNAVAPGHIDTPPNLELFNRSPEHRERFKRRVLQGTVGDRKEIAHAVAFLASDQSRYITGQILNVDGGLSAWQGNVWE
jgi:NAD(P)-dependent dehydrogenase (short-subunit alcohol dehydrogenase family)